MGYKHTCIQYINLGLDNTNNNIFKNLTIHHILLLSANTKLLEELQYSV